jgi:hypothetical protein
MNCSGRRAPFFIPTPFELRNVITCPYPHHGDTESTENPQDSPAGYILRSVSGAFQDREVLSAMAAQ